MGLGNPGPRYAETRHNVGFLVLLLLAERWSVRLKRRLCESKVGEGLILGRPVYLGMPQTSMNGSGQAVGCLIKRWQLEPAQMLVVCDDLSLPLGSIRLRGQGSDGGHKGLASVLDEIHTDEVPRLRVGIRTDRVKGDLTEFVLGRFAPSEKKPLQESLERAVEACEIWVARGLSAAMNQFNQKGQEVHSHVRS